MKKTLTATGMLATLVVAVGVLVTPADAAPTVAVSAATGPVVPDEYIVTTRPGATPPAGIATSHVYRHALSGFAARLDAEQLAAVQRDPGVLAIEPNQLVHALSSQTPTPNWGLDRIDQRTLPLNNTYNYNSAGSRVTVYVIDTGIDPTHPDFGGRASVGFDATGGDGIDCNGHGTHVAGIVGSRTYGVAKKVLLKGVRVLDCIGSGTIANVIAGVDWVRLNSPTTAVANMSLGGGLSVALNNAVNALSASGVFVAVAAGGSGTDACNFSPSGASGAFAVAASDATDHGASFNNTGPCVKLCAPGVGITSTWLGGASLTISGSSMSAPHVAGVAALYKSRVGDVASPTVARWLISVATPGVLIGCPSNLLLHTNLV